MNIRVERVSSIHGNTDFIKITIPCRGNSSHTLCIIGRLGGLNTSDSIGLVSDADS